MYSLVFLNILALRFPSIGCQIGNEAKVWRRLPGRAESTTHPDQRVKGANTTLHRRVKYASVTTKSIQSKD